MFSTFSLLQMCLTPPPTLHDVISEAKSYSLFQKSLEDPSLTPVAFTTHGVHISQKNQCGGHQYGGSGGSRSTSSRGFSHLSHQSHRNNRLPYVPRCQICKVDGHYNSDFPNRYSRSSAPPAQAHLASAFSAMNIHSTDASD